MMGNDVLAGVGLGSLVGCLLGFSSQSAVVGAITAIFGLASGFISIARPMTFAPAAGDTNQNKRIIAFSISAAVMFIASYFTLVNKLLEPSASDLMKELDNAGFSKEHAKILVGGKYYGSLPIDWKKPLP